MKKTIQLAEQQLLGFNHANQGYDLISLVDSMGLTVSELELIANLYPETLSEEQQEEIREHLTPTP